VGKVLDQLPVRLAGLLGTQLLQQARVDTDD